MKKVVCFYLLLALISFAETKQLTNFEEVYDAVVGGEEVRIVIHYAKTDLMIDGKAEEAPDAIGGMDLGTYEYFAVGTVRNEKAYISTSETVLIGHPFYGYVLNYVKLRIYEDDTVEVIAQYLDPNTYEVKMDEKFLGKINNIENEAGIYFYID